MTRRCSLVLLTAMTTGTLASVPTDVQAQPTAAETSPPRTEWGDPDLQGVWDFRTLTPMERPEELGDKQVLTAEEAAQFREGRLAEIAARYDEVPADIVGNYNQFWFDRGTTVVETKRTSLVVDPPDGRIPPLTPPAQEREAARAEARRGIGGDEPTPGGWLEDLGPGGLRVRCILGFNSGPPMTPGGYNNNVQLLQTSEHVVILNEMNHNARIVPLDGRRHLGHIFASGWATHGAIGTATRSSSKPPTFSAKRLSFAANPARACVWSNGSRGSTGTRSSTKSRSMIPRRGRDPGPMLCR